MCVLDGGRGVLGFLMKKGNLLKLCSENERVCVGDRRPQGSRGGKPPRLHHGILIFEERFYAVVEITGSSRHDQNARPFPDHVHPVSLSSRLWGHPPAPGYGVASLKR